MADNSNIAYVNDDAFNDTVLKSKIPVLVDFWATWCKPCAMIAPVLEELAPQYKDKVKFVKMDIEKNKATPAKYHVMSIPTLLIFKNGEPVVNIVGFRPKAELQKNLDSVSG